MALDYQATEAWKTAIALGKPLTLLTEELPAQEDHGLIMTIQGLMVELPAVIALDVLNGQDSTARRLVLLKLQSAVEIVDTVYPALDTAGLKSSISDLIAHSESTDFGTIDAPTTPTVTVLEDGSTPIETTASDAAAHDAEPEPMASTLEPMPIIPTPEPEPEPAVTPTVAATAAETAAASGVTITDPSLLEPTPAPATTPVVSVAVAPAQASAQPSV